MEEMASSATAFEFTSDWLALKRSRLPSVNFFCWRARGLVGTLCERIEKVSPLFDLNY